MFTADFLRGQYDAAIASLSAEQAWAVDIRARAESLGAFTGATCEARRARLFETEAARLNALRGPKCG